MTRRTLGVLLALVLSIGGVYAQGPSSGKGPTVSGARVDRKLQDLLSRGGDSDQLRVIVTLKPGTKGGMLNALRAQGAQVSHDFSVVEAFAGQLPKGLLRALRNNPNVVSLSFDEAVASFQASVGTIYTVTNTSNSGTGSLRQAIIDANGRAGADTIRFNISGSGVRSISVSTALPSISSPVVIDGWSNPGYISTPVIELNGGNAGTGVEGLTLAAGSTGSTVRGLIINRFTGYGIEINGSNNHVIEGNWIGLSSTGLAASANAEAGLYAVTSSGNLIGGTTAASRNVISGNAKWGIYFNNTDNSTISGNYIGTDVNGTADVNGTTSNTLQSGVVLLNGSSNNTVGGASAGTRNVLSGNNHYGFEVMNAASQNNAIIGNYIGTTATGLAALPNVNGGASLWGAGTGNVLGGLAAGTGNVISGNTGMGVLIGNGSTGATIQGNTIGLNATRTAGLGNSTDGVYTDASSNSVIGGTAAGAGNVIAFNGGAGVSIVGGTSHSALGNQIYSNTAQGINVGVSGVQTNFKIIPY
jgi:parallel beta-helix repeat protein